ncbi:MAG TPA: GtrA family protein [Lachnospiraceae bacterium]
MRKLLNQIAKFGLVGIIATGIDYLLMIVLTELFAIPFMISSGISFSISVIFNYILSVVWVFDVDKDKSAWKNFVVFFVLSLMGLAINQGVMWLCAKQLGIFYILSKVIATGLVMVFNFITRKVFLEKRL